MIQYAHHIYLSMIPIGIKPGLLVGALLAAAVAVPTDAEGHYIMLGSAVAIMSAVAISAWNLSGKFRRIMDELEASQKDRASIHSKLKSAEEELKKFQESVYGRLLKIDVKLAGLPCAKGECETEKE